MTRSLSPSTDGADPPTNDNLHGRQKHIDDVAELVSDMPYALPVTEAEIMLVLAFLGPQIETILRQEVRQ